MVSGSMLQQTPDQPQKIRSSRYERVWVGEVAITKTDLAYLEILFRDGPTRAPMLHARVSNGLTSDQYTVRRLRLLHGRPQAYVDRPRVQKHMHWDSSRQEHPNCHHLIYTINRKGVELLRERSVIIDREVEAWMRRHSRQHRQFAHETLVAGVLNSIKLGLKKVPGATFYSIDHILQRAPGTAADYFVVPTITHPVTGLTSRNVKLVPDALFTLEVPGAAERFRLYALEADTGTMPVSFHALDRSSILRKLLCYREIIEGGIYRRQFEMKQPMYCVVVTKAARITSIAGVIRKVAASCGWAFLFRLLDAGATAPDCSDFYAGEWKDIDGRSRYLGR